MVPPHKEIPNIEIYTFSYVYVFSVYVYMHHMGFMLLQRLEEGSDPMELELDTIEPPCGC